MRRALAAVWLAIVAAACVYLTALGVAGFPIRTDLLALLPREEIESFPYILSNVCPMP